MIICHCKAISHRDLERAAESGARTSQDVARQCSAGSCCGGCVEAIRAYLRARRAQRPHIDPHRRAS